VDGNDRGGFPAARYVYEDQDQLKRTRSYCWAEGRRWERSGNAIWSVPSVVNLDRELGDCIDEFPGVEKKQSLLWRDEAVFHILQRSLFVNLHSNHSRNGIGNLKILGFIKSAFSSSRN